MCFPVSNQADIGLCWCNLTHSLHDSLHHTLAEPAALVRWIYRHIDDAVDEAVTDRPRHRYRSPIGVSDNDGSSRVGQADIGRTFAAWGQSSCGAKRPIFIATRDFE